VLGQARLAGAVRAAELLYLAVGAPAWSDAANISAGEETGERPNAFRGSLRSPWWPDMALRRRHFVTVPADQLSSSVMCSRGRAASPGLGCGAWSETPVDAASEMTATSASPD